ncbi:hypothetical protein AVEN_40838-1 [Araneus ventricosus]|uniref:Uncharacterized protein n=1 Tax=Araneus ventricosus TaxID=182803 RepID=A0A4Y2CEJ8_ARAVE|nr:hypothetical protein AVEN_40838-1 [Araneus ventricosus]
MFCVFHCYQHYYRDPLTSPPGTPRGTGTAESAEGLGARIAALAASESEEPGGFERARQSLHLLCETCTEIDKGATVVSWSGLGFGDSGLKVRNPIPLKIHCACGPGAL